MQNKASGGFGSASIYCGSGSLGPIKDARATEAAFSPQKRTSSISKHEISLLFLFLWVIFTLLDPDPDPATQINADLCGSGS
jgi:hypothetical protein